MFIELVTQDRENYGTAEKPYWKNKGGTYYLLPVDQAALLAAENRQVYRRAKESIGGAVRAMSPG